MINISIVSLTIINVTARAAHFVLFLIIGNRFGISNATEEIFFLYAPLLVLMTVTMGVADVIVIPAMHRAKKIQGIWYMRRKFLHIILKIVPLFSAIILLFTWYLSRDVSMFSLLILAPIPILSSISSLYIGVLNSIDKHKFAVMSPIYGSVISIPIIFFVPTTAIGLAIVLLVFEIGRVIGLGIHSNGLKKINDIDLTKMRDLISDVTKNGKWQVMGSLFMGASVYVDILFANTLEVGSITSVEYASRLWNLIPLLFAGYIVTSYANMSKMASIQSLKDTYVYSTATKVGIAAAILSLLLILVRDPLISFIYSFGEMSLYDRKGIADLMACYILGAAPFLVGLVYVRALSAKGEVRTIAIVSFINMIANIILNFIFIRYWNILGIGLATSFTYLLASILLILWYKK